MPKTPKPTTNPDSLNHLIIRLPGWLKNQLIEQANQQNISLNTLCLHALNTWIRTQQQFPPPPPDPQPLPTIADQIRAWACGEQLTQPCGRTDCDPGAGVKLGGCTFCESCGIRLV